jgi:hypothetical protein
MKNVPQFIYLNLGDDPEEKFDDFKDACQQLEEDLTWCESPIDFHTLQYKLVRDNVPQKNPSSMAEKLEVVDDFLARLEDHLHGEEGRECTKCRGILQKMSNKALDEWAKGRVQELYNS